MKVGIIGAGAMGSGIAQIAATAGCEVLVFDTSKGAVLNCRQKLDRILARLVEKERITSQKASRIKNKIHYAEAFQSFEYCDLVIEAIVENAELKKQLFTSLEPVVPEQCIIATNTSSLSVTSLAAVLEIPGRFLGMHFFNPAPLMKLVEIIPAMQTAPEITNRAQDIVNGWGKLTVLAKDTPGFIVNKVARPFYGEALRILEEGIADVTTIDWAMRTMGGFRLGPFELMDYIGNDINYTVSEIVFKAFYWDPRYKPSFIQKRMLEAGYLGRKTNRGFYDYSANAPLSSPNEDEVLGQQIVDRIIIMLINEAADTVHYNVASRSDIEIAMTTGVNFPKGLLKWADDIGIENCVRRMDALYEQYREDRYRCSPLLRKMAAQNITFYSQNESMNA